MNLFLCVNTKGGVGKSTVAQQVAATYLLKKHGESTLFEVDDQNLDASYLRESKIKTVQIKLEGKPSVVADQLFEKTANTPSVIDLGGNETAISVLGAITANGLIDVVDLIFVPVSSGAQDVVNAEKTIEAIQSKVPNAKIVIVLTRQPVKNTNPQDAYIQQYMRKAVRLAEATNSQLMIMPAIDALGDLRDLEMTITEIIPNAESLLDKFKDQALEMRKAGKMAEALDYSARRRAVSEAADAAKWIDELHNQIDELIA